MKVEPNTVFAKKYDSLNLPDDDDTAEQYLYMCETFEKSGYNHYEISNFAKGDKQSRHNLKYWVGQDYLGIGPAAHSCLDGKRFYYPRDLQGFIKMAQTVPDGESGGKEEKLMLGLRLTQGVDLSQIYGEIPLYNYLCTLYKGKYIGHKAICRFPAISTNKIIVKILKSNGEAVIKSIKAFYVSE